MKYGVAYYPEHRTAEEIERDIELMAAAGLNVVRMGEFAWSRMEPAAGQYDFTWLDRAIEALGRAGISTIICTPTAAPPAWLVEQHPEILYMDNRGVIRPFGARRHYCYNSPVYREYSKRVAEKLARHYGPNPYVLAFHIDNELAQETTGRCQCSVCRWKFQEWLCNKYGTIEELNDKWGTIFWSQEYDRFSQMRPPQRSTELGAEQPNEMYYDNPSLRLDFERFSSQSIIEFQNCQVHVISSLTDKLVTSNATGLGTSSINYHEAFENLDRYSLDLYPNFRGNEMDHPAFSYSFARGVKPGLPFWIVEFGCGGGHGLWGKQGTLQPYPGAMKQAVVHAFASGAELLTHFQWATFRFGAEQLDGAVVDADGVPRRRYREIADTAAELRRLKPFLEHSTLENDAAICWDYDVLWALKIKPINRGFDYMTYCNRLYTLLTSLGLGVDVLRFGDDISRYNLVVLPTPFLMNDGSKSTLRDYVYNGGTVISTFLTAVKDSYNVVPGEVLPSGLTDLFGIHVTEYEPVFSGTEASIVLDTAIKNKGTNQLWTEVIESCGADIIGRYESTFRRGEAVISRNRYGAGHAYYLGTDLDDKTLLAFLETVISRVSLRRAPVQGPRGVEVLTRYHQDDPMYFIFNFTMQPVTIEIGSERINMLTGDVISGQQTIGEKSYLVIR